MREIKFRAISHDTKEFVYGDFYQGPMNSIICSVEYVSPTWSEPGGDSILVTESVDIKTLGQYTGLKDKNGVEIYCGDIVECSMSYEGGSLPHMGEIVYMDSFAAFATKNLAGETLFHNHLLNTFLVVGNIHQNPELLS